MIAERGLNTLILVHRRLLMDQWIERLATFSSLPREAIGVIGGGRRKPKGLIDVALIQSLVRKGEVDDLVGGYGHVIVDECHHLSAVSFELVARRAKARYVLGLSATVDAERRSSSDHCDAMGPVRYRVDPRSEAARRPFDHLVRIRENWFQTEQRSEYSAPCHSGDFRRAYYPTRAGNYLFSTIFCARSKSDVARRDHRRTVHLEALRRASNVSSST